MKIRITHQYGINRFTGPGSGADFLFAWSVNAGYYILPNNPKVLFTQGKIMSKVG